MDRVFVWVDDYRVEVYDISHVDRCIHLAEEITDAIFAGGYTDEDLVSYVEEVKDDINTLKQGHGLLNYLMGYVTFQSDLPYFKYGTGIVDVKVL